VSIKKGRCCAIAQHLGESKKYEIGKTNEKKGKTEIGK